MSRYFSRPSHHIARTGKMVVRPRAEWCDNEFPLLPQITVDDHEAVETGLVDHRGDPIMRAPNPMGFGCDL